VKGTVSFISFLDQLQTVSIVAEKLRRKMWRELTL
jgi:hypothetical protein